MRLATVVGFLIGVASAQSLPSFEVASIKPAPPQPMGHMSVRMSSDAARVAYSNVNLRDVIVAAYKVKEKQISGPEWLDTARWDIQAKVPADVPKEQIPAMLQALLAERFAMKLHRETKTMSVYALVEAKSGVKAHVAANQEGNAMNTSSGPKGRTMKGSFSMESLAVYLSNRMDRPVIDVTGLSEKYDVEMTWNPDEKTSGSGDTAEAPSIYTALQETLGLKLEARKMPVEMLVIDSVNKVPIEN